MLSLILAMMFISAIYTILYLNYLTYVQEKELKSVAMPGLKETAHEIIESGNQVLAQAS
ncbi:MAG TPA: hypothetical protein VLJ41_10495 [Segetibacter sp.]|nr:hypothetical protein [Segetibacter sp.]